MNLLGHASVMLCCPQDVMQYSSLFVCEKQRHGRINLFLPISKIPFIKKSTASKICTKSVCTQLQQYHNMDIFSLNFLHNFGDFVAERRKKG